MVEFTARLVENGQSVGVPFRQAGQSQIVFGQRGERLEALPGGPVPGEGQTVERRDDLEEAPDQARSGHAAAHRRSRGVRVGEPTDGHD